MTARECDPSLASDYIRLHITPLSQDVFERLIPEAIRRVGKNTSFHQLQTFPERNYGYVEIPRSDAEKLKKKLNGSILKGQKISIEEARPMPKRKVDAAAIEAEKLERKRIRKERRKQALSTIVEGHQLEDGRHVKRGWKEDKQHRKKARSEDDSRHHSGSADKRALFKTVIPPNAKEIPSNAQAKTKTNKKENKKLSGKNNSKTTTVEEFSKNKQTFATGQSSSRTGEIAGFEDGKGWVDTDGNVVEAVSTRRRNNDLPGQAVVEKSSIPPIAISTEASVRHEETGSSEQPTEQMVDRSPLSAIRTASSSDESDDQSGASTLAAGRDNEADLVSATTVSDTREIHPLEALYKRNKPEDGKVQLAPLQTSFSFFSNPQTGAVNDGADANGMHPLTPHTTQDMEYRRRAAAPTPDTALVGGRFGFPFGGDDSDESDEHNEDGSVEPQVEVNEPASTAAGSEKPESAFRKFFYEKRGESDRAWKQRRREMKKLQRQRENKRLSRKVV